MEPEFFEQMVMPLFDQLYNFAHWLTGAQADAEDLVQETYVRALKGFGSFEAGTDLRAWMYRILRNTFLTSRSGLAAKRTTSLEDDVAEPISPELTPELLLLREEGKVTVSNALAALPVDSREVLLLFEMEEMSYREIAGVLGVPIGTVMSRLSRARKMMRLALKGEQ
jgi:RNA polymerase sigma-70 factor (ECF subfamily)